MTVGELARGGLGRYPAAIGVYWPREQVVVCRGHVTSTGHRKAMARHRSPGDEAIVLVSSPDGARKLRRECVHCKETGR